MNRISTHTSMPMKYGLTLGLLLFMGAATAHATATVVPTGAYVPPQQTHTDQQVNINVGGIKVDASNSGGANISIPGIGTIQANKNGANINVNTNGTNVSVSASSQGANVQVNGITVRSDTDLQKYTQQVQASNPLITSIQPSATDVRIGYTESGKLFGFVPVVMNDTVVVDNSGKVTVQRPWYGIFVTSSANDVKAKVGQSLQGTNVNGSLDVQAQAKIVSGVNSVLVQTH